MTIPKFQQTMYPFLNFISDGGEHHWRDVLENVSKHFNLTEEEKREKLPSGYNKIIDNRVAWTRTYFKKAGLLEYPKKGYVKITERGLKLLENSDGSINIKVLKQFPEFVEFSAPKQKETKHLSTWAEVFPIESTEETPEELINKGHGVLMENLMHDLLEKLRSNSPDFFEKVVVKLIKKMGYGEGTVTGGPYDGGIDGIIYQDILGVDKIYLQAKRNNEKNLTSPAMIKNFIASLDIAGATKGIFITTSRFVGNVKELCEKTPKTIILIDGEKLVKLMIEHDVGVIIKETYKIKDIDENYFEE